MQWTKLVLAITMVVGLICQVDLQQGYASLIKMSIEDLAHQADCILVGRVLDIKSKWNRENTTILTYVRVAVEKTIKGVVNTEEVFVKVPGGEVEDMVLEVSGAPQFSIDENVILFLNRDISGEYQVIGGVQGKYTLRDGKVLGREVSIKDFIAELSKTLDREERDKPCVKFEK